MYPLNFVIINPRGPDLSFKADKHNPPKDIILHIFSYLGELNYVEYKTLSHVCRSWQRIVIHHVVENEIAHLRSLFEGIILNDSTVKLDCTTLSSLRLSLKNFKRVAIAQLSLSTFVPKNTKSLLFGELERCLLPRDNYENGNDLLYDDSQLIYHKEYEIAFRLSASCRLDYLRDSLRELVLKQIVDDNCESIGIQILNTFPHSFHLLYHFFFSIIIKTNNDESVMDKLLIFSEKLKSSRMGALAAIAKGLLSVNLDKALSVLSMTDGFLIKEMDSINQFFAMLLIQENKFGEANRRCIFISNDSVAFKIQDEIAEKKQKLSILQVE